MPKQLPELQEGKINYLSTADNIISKKQFSYDAKNEAEAIADTFTQTALWMDFFTIGRAIWSMDSFTRDHLIWHQEGFLRDGYLQRIYSKVYPMPTPHLPGEPGKDIVAKTTSQLKMHDDISGREMFELTAALDYEFARGAEAYIDPAKFEQFVNLHSMKVGEALGRQWGVLSSLYCMAHYPGSTLSRDIDLAPFLDQTLRPDKDKSPTAHAWFDKDSKFWKTICLKEIVGQAQAKLTNIGFYCPEVWDPGNEDITVKKQTQPTAVTPDNKTKSIFFEKKGSDQKLRKGISPFSCLFALTNAIREKWISMTQINSPTNMGSYKPYQTAAQDDFQQARKARPQDLEIILNPYDWAKIKQNIRNTSQYGNYTATLDDIIAAGTRIYVKDTMLPGHFIIQERETYMGIIILNQLYQQNFDFCLAVQRGAHLFGKVYISGLTCFYKGIPLSYIPPQEYMYNNFTSLSAA